MTWLLIIFVTAYILIATEKVEKSIAAGLGAVAVIVGHFEPYEMALHHIDLNVLFLLIGMMLMVNVMGTTGLFEWLAIVIGQKAKGRGLLIFVMFLLATALLSAFLDNVTTVILIAPITILITQILEIPVVPFLVFEALFSNIGGAATLVGDPPNVLICSQAEIPFNDFLIHLGPVVLVIMALVLVATVLAFRKAMYVRPAARERIMQAEPRLAILDVRKLKFCLGVFALVLTGFFLGHALDIEPGIVALGGGVLMVLVTRSDMEHALRKVEWNTILFFIGLFILVGALQDHGAFTWLGEQVLAATRGNLMLTALAVLWISAIASAIVDNIPLVIAMVPLIRSIIPAFCSQMGLEPGSVVAFHTVTEPLFWSLALGACLGGNGTLIGASANVVLSQIARKNRYPITFWTFTRYGAPVMLLSLVVCSLYLWLRYFA
jgi:Na+/H+ antiporter NhaD/arsenite permease-like protein